jgi:hypothetical protein
MAEPVPKILACSAIGIACVLVVAFSYSTTVAQNAASDSQATGSIMSSTRSAADRGLEFIRRLDKLRQFSEECLRRNDLPVTAEAMRILIEPCINDHLSKAGERWHWDARRDDISDTEMDFPRATPRKQSP